MGASAGGALNTRGFSYAVQQNQIPSYQHITHAGTYNEHFFEVGNKAKELLELHTGVGVSNCHLFGLPNRNFFLSLFLKSNKDGQPRVRNINACIALDISGSMNSNLSYQKPSEKTRLMLARDAILMFFEKMKQNDIFSLVVFHNQARTIIQSDYVKNMDKEKVRQAIYQQFESGGTTIKSGFDESVKQINRFKADISNYQNRIIMLTDVCDNSVENEKKLIHDIAQTNEIGTTIIGVSSDFKAQTCEKLKEVKGFNYFCAVEDCDLKTFLVDRFDWTFFPCVQNISIRLVSDKISDIKVYGSADQERKYQKQGNNFVISKFTSIFPSQIIENKVKKDEIESLGGLILVKFTPINPQLLPEVYLKILLDYEDLEGHKYSKQYVIKQKVSAEEFYSDSAVTKGVQLFYYAQTMRNLLKTMNENFSQASKIEYLQNLQRLGDYCPQSKKQQLQDVIKVVKAK